MRPRYLEIEGLQSFKEIQTVDFDKLGETGLFGIFGPTGSGKSTILDAITLALYGNVQRAARGTQGIANTDMNSVKVAFVFDLLKNGERRTFRVERTYKRKKASDNSVEIKVARLIEIIGDDTIILADKPAEVSNSIVELIGLKDDDFTRSVVLPQNKFQEFLMMDKAKKRDMMERIFYLEEYGRNLTEKVSKKLSAVKFSMSGIEGAISALGEMSEKYLIELEGLMKKAYENKESIDVKLKLAEIQLNEAKEVWDIVRDINTLLGREEKLLENKELNDRNKEVFELGQKASDIGRLIEKYLEDEKNLNTTIMQLEEIGNKLPAALEELEKAKLSHDLAVKEAEEVTPALIERRSKLTEALKAVTEINDMSKNLAVLREDYKKLKLVLEQKIKEINQIKSDIEFKETSINDTRQQMEDIKDDLDYRQQVQNCLTLEDNIKLYGGDKKSKELREAELLVKITNNENELTKIKKLIFDREGEASGIDEKIKKLEESNPGSRAYLLSEGEQYHELKSSFETLKILKRNIDSDLAKKNELNYKKEELKNRLTETENNRKLINERQLNINEQLQELLNKKEQNTASILARALEHGAPCPVCGSKEHPAPANLLFDDCSEELEGKIKDVQNSLLNIELQYKEADLNCIKLTEQIKGIESQLTQASENLASKENEYNSILNKLPENIKQKSFEDIDLYIDELNLNRNRKIEALEAWETEKTNLETQKSEINKLLAQFKTDEARRSSELDVNKENMKVIRTDIDEADAKINEATGQYAALTKLLGIGSASEEMKRLDSNRRKSNELQKQLDDSQLKLKDMRNTLDKLEAERQKLGDELNEVRTNGEILRVKKEEAEKKLEELTAGKEIEAELKELETKLKKFEKCQNDTQSRVKELEKQYNEYESKYKLLENQRDIFEKVFRTESEKLNNALEDKGFSNVEEAKKYILPEDELTKLKSQIDDYENAAKNIQANKQLLQSKLKDRMITEDEWSKVQGDYTQLKTEKDKSISSYENARSNYISYKNNFSRWLELDKDRQKIGRKKDMLEQLQKLLKGNSFIEFISEERLRYIAKEASDTLGILTKYRYSIELDAENGFVIRDDSSGGVNRLVTSLSGGETFLTSLSLALALSSQIQLKGQSPLEFFFLDEGFGTLDKELLDTVIDSLERLSSTKKVIGLISHVPELRERINRRLIVEPPAADGRGSRVALEKA